MHRNSKYKNIKKNVKEAPINTENKISQETNQFTKDLIKMIVHDMRVPLTAISGSLEMISDTIGTTLPANAKKMMAIAMSSSKMLINMVDDLQDIGKIEINRLNLKKTSASINDIVLDAISGMEIWAGKRKICIEVDISKTSPNILIDAERFKRVVLNLLSNAMNYTPSGGNISVKVFHDNEYVYTSVTDKGEGIPEEYHEFIFDKFFQVDARRSKQKNSSGLGLYYCKLMTEAHNGRIVLKSTPGNGSTFTVILPVC